MRLRRSEKWDEAAGSHLPTQAAGALFFLGVLHEREGTTPRLAKFTARRSRCDTPTFQPALRNGDRLCRKREERKW